MLNVGIIIMPDIKSKISNTRHKWVTNNSNKEYSMTFESTNE